jgi:hypothetical protein
MSEIKIIEVHFSRKFNLGNYETQDVGFVATVSDHQDYLVVLKELDKRAISYRKYQLESKRSKSHEEE